MEHILPRSALLILGLVGSLTLMHAQTCTPITTWPGEEFFLPEPYLEELPGSGIQDTACVGVPFSTVFNLRVPDLLFVNPLTIPVSSADMATTGGILNLPAGLEYACNPPNCIFTAETNSCIVVYGTAVPGSEGVADLQFTLLFRSTFNIPATLPDQQLLIGNYFLHVKPAGDPACLATGVLQADPSEWGVFPNPTTGMIQFPRPFAQAQVFDRMGRSVMEPVVSTTAIDLTQLPPGLYLVRVRTDQHVHTTRVWKE